MNEGALRRKTNELRIKVGGRIAEVTNRTSRQSCLGIVFFHVPAARAGSSGGGSVPRDDPQNVDCKAQGVLAPPPGGARLWASIHREVVHFPDAPRPEPVGQRDHRRHEPAVPDRVRIAPQVPGPGDREGDAPDCASETDRLLDGGRLSASHCAELHALPTQARAAAGAIQSHHGRGVWAGDPGRAGSHPGARCTRASRRTALAAARGGTGERGIHGRRRIRQCRRSPSGGRRALRPHGGPGSSRAPGRLRTDPGDPVRFARQSPTRTGRPSRGGLGDLRGRAESGEGRDDPTAQGGHVRKSRRRPVDSPKNRRSGRSTWYTHRA
jgi:hypothetical protein